uniref:HLH domain-containing protein n=1 Tax=Bathyctena chuni TaxID=1403704 RepID=V9PNT4_BATCU|nr:HLH domain-containing protein [Bathyctena chuni]
MVMENFVSPFIGIPFPMQAESSISENSCLPPSSAHSSAKSRKNSRKRRKLSGMKRIAATTRERSRIEHLNCAFITLRSRIPTQPSDVKLTKVETLRLAMSYILHLEKLVADIEAQKILGTKLYIRTDWSEFTQVFMIVATVSITPGINNMVYLLDLYLLWSHRLS